MASSSSSTLLSSSPFDFSALPVMSLKERIVEKIRKNRITLIVGETGCGMLSSYCVLLVVYRLLVEGSIYIYFFICVYCNLSILCSMT